MAAVRMPLILAVKHSGTESPHSGRDPPRLIRAAFQEGWKRGAGIYTPSPLLEPEEGGSLIFGSGRSFATLLPDRGCRACNPVLHGCVEARLSMARKLVLRDSAY